MEASEPHRPGGRPPQGRKEQLRRRSSRSSTWDTYSRGSWPGRVCTTVSPDRQTDPPIKSRLPTSPANERAVPGEERGAVAGAPLERGSPQLSAGCSHPRPPGFLSPAGPSLLPSDEEFHLLGSVVRWGELRGKPRSRGSRLRTERDGAHPRGMKDKALVRATGSRSH